MSQFPSRAEALWRRFVGLFGGDALTRKFGPTPPEEWTVMIDRLKEYELERGVRRLTYSGKSYIPSLPEFLKLCREVASDQFPDEQRPAHVSQIAGPQSHMDGWDAIANNHLMGYITRKAQHKIYYCSTEMAAGEFKAFDPDSQTIALTQPLVQAKNVWASDMREAHAAGTVPEDHGKVWWDAAMKNAEAVVIIVRGDQQQAA